MVGSSAKGVGDAGIRFTFFSNFRLRYNDIF